MTSVADQTMKDTPYLTLMDELWGVFDEYIWENDCVIKRFDYI